jgi:hypothetical protein
MADSSVKLSAQSRRIAGGLPTDGAGNFASLGLCKAPKPANVRVDYCLRLLIYDRRSPGGWLSIGRRTANGVLDLLGTGALPLLQTSWLNLSRLSERLGVFQQFRPR